VASVPALTDLTVADLWREVKDPERLWGDVSQHTLRTVKLLLENRMHDELVDYLTTDGHSTGSNCSANAAVSRVFTASQSSP